MMVGGNQFIRGVWTRSAALAANRTLARLLAARMAFAILTIGLQGRLHAVANCASFIGSDQ
jgi:hypothetical protein